MARSLCPGRGAWLQLTHHESVADRVICLVAVAPKLAAFERAIASYVGRKHAIAVNSGTSGLHLLVRAFGIGEGDEVITTPFSFIASSNCILYERAKPVLVVIEPDTADTEPSPLGDAIEDTTIHFLRLLPPYSGCHERANPRPSTRRAPEKLVFACRVEHFSTFGRIGRRLVETTRWPYVDCVVRSTESPRLADRPQ